MRIIILIPIFIILIGSSITFAERNSIIPPVFVTANYTLTHAPKTIITQEDIATSGSSTVAQVLHELGGVQLQDTTGNGSQVILSMHGFGSNANSNTLLLVNGIPMSHSDLAPTNLNSIPIQEIESVEIISGSESILYGDQAVGGIINIVTKQHSKEKTALFCSGGSYQSRHCSAILNKKIDQINSRIHLSNQHSDNYRNHNNYDQNQLLGNLNYKYETGEVIFNYQIANERMQYPGALTSAQVSQNRRQATNDSDFFRNWNGFYHFQNQQKLNSNWRIETDLSRREMHGDGVLTSPFFQSRVAHFVKPQLKGALGDLSLTSGIDFEDDHYYLSSLYGVTNDSQQKYGLFTAVNYPITSRLSLSAGLRGAQQNNQLRSTQTTNRINNAFANTLGTTFKYKPNIQFYLRRAENFRFPKADENAFAATTTGLKTQRGVSYESGIHWHWKKVMTQFGLYQLNLNNEIAFDPTQTSEQPFGTNRNLDPTVRRGFFLKEKFHATQQLTFDGQYNFVNARFNSGINSNHRIPLVSENILHAGANYEFMPHWNLYSEAIYTGNQYAANDDGNIAGKMGGYTFYNFNLRYIKNNFSAAFRINNLFNKYYYLYTLYQPSIQQEYFYPAAGRNFLLTLNYQFT